MIRALLALGLLVLLAHPVAAQTTTSTSTSSSTSSSTSTSTTLILSWSCVRDFTAIMQPNPYVAMGHCTATGAYQNGGAALGSAATASATALALCGSGNQTVVDLIMSPQSASGVANYYCSFSLTTFLLQCATTIGTEISTSNVTPGPFDYVAFCK